MAVVIDTNVWAVAAEMAEQADEDCVEACVDTIAALRTTLVLAVDDSEEIIHEYFRRLPENSAQCRTLGQLIHRSGRIEYRPCRPEASGDWRLPDCLDPLDRSDRKFAAVALTYDPPAPIYNAVDTDWRECAAGLAEAGLEVTELCPQCLR
ncbi:hypothetical protein LLH23_06035 [bacterium]|nr:hypothetical protein [bacterium]